VPKPLGAVEKASSGAKHILSGMVAETLVLAEAKALIKLSPNTDPLIESWYQKGESYHKKENYAEAAKWYRMAADKGHAEAQFSMAYLYVYGFGVPYNLREAASWYQKAAEQGHAEAQYYLGCFYDKATGRRAGGWGTQRSENNLGAYYDKGPIYGVIPSDVVEAAKWYRRAAEQDVAEAQFELGLCYMWGEGVPHDEGEANRWFKKAAEQKENDHYENDIAMISISNRCEGLSDLVEAFKWLMLAQKSAYTEWAFDRLLPLLTKEQIAEAEKRYREFRSQKI
jgi:TPR repeat protein